MKRFYSILWLMGLLSVPFLAQARVLSYGEPAWAVTLKLHGAWMGAGNSAYGLDIPEDFKWEDGLDSAWGLEPGLFFHKGKVSVHLGFMYLTPRGQDKVQGTSKVDPLRSVTLNLKHSIFAPQAILEFDVLQGAQSRLYLGTGAGLATLKARHSYELSPALTADWGVAELEQKFEAQSIAKYALVGGEYWLGQDTALALELGYRDLFFRKLKYSQPAALPDGVRPTGELLKRHGAHPAALNHGGAFATLGIKTYIRIF